MSMATTSTTATPAAVQAPLSRVGPTLSDRRRALLAVPPWPRVGRPRRAARGGRPAPAGGAPGVTGGRGQLKAGGGTVGRPGARDGPRGPAASHAPRRASRLGRLPIVHASCIPSLRGQIRCHPVTGADKGGAVPRSRRAMTRSRDFMQVDVFTIHPLPGQPGGCRAGRDRPDDEQMQQVASWTNLSETTFVLPPTAPAADYRATYLHPLVRAPFRRSPDARARHMLLWPLAARPRDSVVQECAAGLVTVRRSEAGLAFAAPPRSVRAGRRGSVGRGAGRPGGRGRRGGRGALGRQRAGMGGRAAGRRRARSWRSAPAPSGRSVTRSGLFGPYPPGSEFAYEVRAFFPRTAPPSRTRSRVASTPRWPSGWWAPAR